MLPLPGSRYARTVLMVVVAPIGRVGGTRRLAEVLPAGERTVSSPLLPGADLSSHRETNVKSLQRRCKQPVRDADEPIGDADAPVHVEAAGAGEDLAALGLSPDEDVPGEAAVERAVGGGGPECPQRLRSPGRVDGARKIALKLHAAADLARLELEPAEAALDERCREEGDNGDAGRGAGQARQTRKRRAALRPHGAGQALADARPRPASFDCRALVFVWNTRMRQSTNRSPAGRRARLCRSRRAHARQHAKHR